MFDFASSPNSYVDSLNDVYSGKNMDLSWELSAKENCLLMVLFPRNSSDQELHLKAFKKERNVFHVDINDCVCFLSATTRDFFGE